jgi:DNA-binding LacI/PurR family transcriptional regulator
MGHRRIGFSSAHNVEESISARDRYFGYCQALSDNGIGPTDDYFVSVPEIRNSIDTFMFHGVLERLLDRQDPVTAIQALNDYEAISLLKAALESGVKVPEQLSLVGFDNIELTEHVEVPLTTVEQDFYGIGCRAASLLLDQLQGRALPPESRVTVVPAKLIERDSVADLRR